MSHLSFDFLLLIYRLKSKKLLVRTVAKSTRQKVVMKDRVAKHSRPASLSISAAVQLEPS